MGKILELQKAVYRKILFSHLKNIKNPQLIELVIESMERIDRDNIIVGLKKSEYGITTDIYLFSSQDTMDILHTVPNPLPYLPWEQLPFDTWNCINYEFDEAGELSGTKIYIDNFSYALNASGTLIPQAYFSEYSGSGCPPNAVYIDQEKQYIFVDTDTEVKKTIGVKLLKNRNALYFNNLTYEACIKFLEKWFSSHEIDTGLLKKYGSYLAQSRDYHVCYDIFLENGENRIINMGFFLQI